MIAGGHECLRVSCRHTRLPAGLLIPPPPWHYAGQVFSLAFTVDANRGQCLLPDGFGRATGGAAGHFCEWQWTSDGSELLDPVYAQYKEFVALIEAERNGERALYCPFIYVDQDRNANNRSKVTVKK